MSGGIHRVAQSRWNCPQAGRATTLSLYFSLDSALPIGGYLQVGMPTGASHTPTIATPTVIHAWTLGTTLDPPTAQENAATCTFSDPTLACTFAKALAAKTSYGLAIPGTGAVAGMWAPVTMQTRMNNVANAGPVRDVNRVFDQIATDATAPTFTMAAVKTVTTPEKKYPGETAEVVFTVTQSWSETTDPGIKAPWNLVLTLGTKASRAQVSTSATWIKYPVTYDQWTWVATCTNTQWGKDDADTTDKTPAVTLANKTPKCTAKGQVLTIPIAEDFNKLGSENKLIFKISVKLPGNFLGSTTLDAMMTDPNSNNVYATAAQVASFLTVAKPTGQLDTQGAALVSFGVNPKLAAEQAKGVGIYSTPFCLVAGGSGFGANLISNCGNTQATIVGANPASTGTKVMDLVNAIELTWTLPYAIPSDRTEAVITCKTEQDGSGNTPATFYSKDPLRIMMSSLMTKGWGTGNCFYQGVLTNGNTGPGGSHRILCANTGPLAKSAALQVAFQYTLSNQGKSYIAGDASATTKGMVQLKALILNCKISINTYTSATSSAVNWYESTLTLNIDGNTEPSKSGAWSSFLITKDTKPSMGQKGNLNTFEQSDTACDVEVWLLLSSLDSVATGAAASGKRQFPFVTSATASLDGFFRGYAAAVKSAPTLALLIPAFGTGTGEFKAAALNHAQGMTWAFTGFSTLAKDTTTSSGTTLISFKLARDLWGNSCCASTCNGVTKKCDKTTGNLQPFATNALHQIAHSWMDATVLNAVVGVKFTGVVDMPTHLTTLRGKGGWGTTQKLMDMFWLFCTSTASSRHISTLLHMYVSVKVAKADADMKVTYGFPLNTYGRHNEASADISANDGTLALGVGLKLYIAPTGGVPLEDYYGFYVLRMTPFFKATGGNEIDTVVNGDSSRTAVQCWYHGSNNGQGWCLLHNGAWTTFQPGKYFATIQYGQMPLVICKVGKTAGVATHGDVVIIPSWQSKEAGTNVNNMLPGHGIATPVAANSPTGVAVCANTNNQNLAILAGKDQDLAEMITISNANTGFNTVVIAATVKAASGTQALPGAYSGGTLNNNANVNTRFDINAKTTANWLIGAAKLEAIMTFGLGEAANWSDPQGILEVCTNQAGAAIPSSLDMHDNNVATTAKCSTAYTFTVGAADPLVVTGYSTRKQRQCRFCKATFATPNVLNYIKDFVPPTTANRLLNGITVWAADTAGAARLAGDTQSTFTKQKAVNVPASGCGKSGQTTKLSTLGQSIVFSIKSPVPLAAGQFVFWEDKTAAGVKNFQISGAVPANSVTCTCGSNTWTATFAKASAVLLKLTMPNAAVGATSAVVCPAGDVTCTLREWSTGSTDVADATISCFACDSGGTACTTTKSTTVDNGSNDLGVAKYVQAVTFTLKQNGAAATTPDVLKVRDVNYQPHTKSAIGRFFYKPSTSMALYATSTIAYTFGSQAFGTGAICQVFTSSGTAPSTTASDLVNACVISGSVVTVTMAKDGAASFHVQIVGIVTGWGAVAGTVTGTVTNFGNAVQTAGTASNTNVHTALSVVGTAATNCNDVSTVATTVTLARSLVNVMDVGMMAFTITPKKYDWDVNSYAFISFPTYYNPNIGDMMRCSLYDATKKADIERLYCATAWDYTLQVWGPATAAKKDTAFVLRVYGVSMNSFGTALNFGVGLTNSTVWASRKWLNEYKTVVDAGTGSWAGKKPIDVTKVALSSSQVRSTTDITIDFVLPKASTTADSNYVAVQLPYQWMGVAKWMDGSAAPTMTLSKGTVSGTGTAKKTTYATVKGTVGMVSGCHAVFTLDTAATKLAEEGIYRLVVGGVATAENGAMAANMAMGSLVLSVGKSDKGGLGYSSAQLFNSLPALVPATGIALLEFKSTSVAVSRGSYTKNAVCIQAGSGNLAAAISAAVVGTKFKTNPATLSAAMGAASACGDLGTASGTQASTHNLYWTVSNGTAKYTQLPTMQVSVNSVAATVNVPSAVTCSKGGKSVPMVVTASAIPFSDVKVSLLVSTTVDGTKTTDNSAGITPNTNVVTLKIGSDSGVLGFACSSDPKGKELKYKIDGTDKATFALSSLVVAVTAAKAGTKPASPKLTLTMKSDTSKAASTVIEGECPGMGAAWMQFAPAAKAAAILSKVADVTAAHGKFNSAAANMHTLEQWCYGAVTAAGQKTTCTFSTASNQNYTVALYCETIEGWFFASAKNTAVQSKDNGGKTVGLTLTYKKAINDVTNNGVVLNICGKLAETMAVPYSRVTDAYGGYFGSASATLPASAPKPAAAATNATKNTTKRMLNATANKTTTPSEYKLNLFVQPDPFAAKADNAATMATVTGTAALAAINAVTQATYGAMTAKAATVTEAKVSWVKKPAATGGKKMVTLAGSTNVGGYVYCGVNKQASRRFRMLNASNASNTSTTTAAATPAASTAVTSLQSSQAAQQMNIQRQETKAGALAFSLQFSGLGEGKTYSWMCEATSLNPSNPAFRTAMEKGTASTTAAPVVPAGDSALWSSLFAAILMIAAVFFY